MNYTIAVGRGDVNKCHKTIHFFCQLQHEASSTGVRIQCHVQRVCKFHCGSTVDYDICLPFQELTILETNTQIWFSAIPRYGHNTLQRIGLSLE